MAPEPPKVFSRPAKTVGRGAFRGSLGGVPGQQAEADAGAAGGAMNASAAADERHARRSDGELRDADFERRAGELNHEVGDVCGIHRRLRST